MSICADGRGVYVSLLEIAMMGKLLYTALRGGVFALPALGELLNTLFATPDTARTPERQMAAASSME